MAKSAKEEDISIPFDIKKWDTYPVGTFKKKTKTIEDAVINTIERFVKIVPSIKKSSKLMMYASTGGYVPMYINATSGCKIECISNDEKGAKQIAKSVEALELEDKVTVSHKAFNKTLFHRNTFDMVWSIAENYHDDDALEIFREVARVLVPEGRFVMCHKFKSDTTDNSLLEDMAIISKFLRKASIVDLERVYVKEYRNETIAHYTALLKEKKITKKDKELIENYLELAKEDEMVWALLVFQKRNM